MKIMGYKKVEFTGDDNIVINGFTVFLFGDYDRQIDGNVRGCYAEKVFLSDQKFKDLKVAELYEAQKEVIPLYNKYGKIERFI